MEVHAQIEANKVGGRNTIEATDMILMILFYSLLMSPNVPSSTALLAAAPSVKVGRRRGENCGVEKMQIAPDALILARKISTRRTPDGRSDATVTAPRR
jgi:hypothetical protein